MKANTVIFGFYDKEEQVDFFHNDPSYELIRNSVMNETEFLKLRNENQRNISAEDYVALIHEAIFKFQKNVCIGRYFNKFQRVSRQFFKVCCKTDKKFLFRIRFLK